MFNTNPFFNDADLIVVDDAHAAENYIAALWSVKVERHNPKHAPLHKSLSNLLKSVIDPLGYSRLAGRAESQADKSWVDKLPTPTLNALREELTEIFEEYADTDGIEHPWSLIREHLLACHLYMSPGEILIRPLIPPTWAHAPFEKARQRLFMSATLGAGGDLERLTGRKNIFRVPIPEGWDRQGVGRRFFIFPAMSLKDDEAQTLALGFMKEAGRSLVLVPSDKREEASVKVVQDKLKFRTFTAEAIETSKKQFVDSDKAVAIVANRYDGIDFPGDECRLLFVEGFPKAMNLQERFLMSKMAANVLFNERIQTRILQAIGRCTRSLEDYSAVVVDGDDLPDYLADIKRRKYFHPELQAELRFGIDQSKGSTLTGLRETFSIFLKNDQEWEEVNQQIVRYRNDAQQQPFPAMAELSDAVPHEIDFQTCLWQGDFVNAFDASCRVLGVLKDSELKGYRALWHYEAGSAASLAFHEGIKGFDIKAHEQFEAAKKTAPAVPWLVKLSRNTVSNDAQEGLYDSDLMEQLERVEALLERLGTLHDGNFSRLERQILDGLESKDNKVFEEAHKQLGEVIGFAAGKVENDGSPDPWWLCGKTCLVFEDYAFAKDDAALDVTKARQVYTHPNWIKMNIEAAQGANILPVLLTPATKVKEGALPHLDEVALWRLAEFKEWATTVFATLRAQRISFLEPGNLVWRADAATAFIKGGLDASGLAKRLRGQPAKSLLTPAK